MKKYIWTMIFVIGGLFNNHAFAWNDTTTHPHITKMAYREAKLTDYFSDQLRITDQQTFKIEGLRIDEWIAYGAVMEDDPSCRASNHFHNPYNANGPLNWQDAGLTDIWLPMIPYCAMEGWQGDYPTGRIKSNMTWATGCLSRECSDSEKDDYSITNNPWDWPSARQNFYTYLTGRDAAGNIVATTKATRDAYLADTLRGLGQTMHLLQDMAVPAHVRDDFSHGHLMVIPGLENPQKWVGNDFEKYVERHDERWWFAGTAPIRSNLNNMRLTDLWDTDQLSNGLVPSGLGLAESTSLNFMSGSSAFKAPFYYPHPLHCAVEAKEPPIEDSAILDRLYVVSTHLHPGQPVEHLAVVSYLKYFRDVFIDRILDIGVLIHRDKEPYAMDSRCHEDYAAKLIPQAIGYSADLLDYFFRGRMEVTALPYFIDNRVMALKLSITNTTATQEMMRDGVLSLVLRYRPEGAGEDGSEDVFVPAIRPLGVSELAFNETTEVVFDFSGLKPLPIEQWDTVQATLTFCGTLGNEAGAVVGKVFTPGRVLFNEEWDKGLFGNYDWQSSADVQNVDNGTTVRTIENGILIMENLRYASSIEDRTNDLCVELADGESNGVPIGPGAEVQFIIDEMTTAPVDPYGAYHFVEFFFNDKLALQYSTDRSFIQNHKVTTLYRLFEPGGIISENIHDLFASNGIAVPDPLYLNRIVFLQQMYNVSGEYRMELAADAIRIVDQNAE